MEAPETQHGIVEAPVEVFKALANPNRLRIFLRLISCCPPGTKCSSEEAVRRCVGELGQDLEIDPSTVSHHLKELRRAGLIRVERRGKHILGWVDRETVETVANLLSGRLPADIAGERRPKNDF